MAFESNIITMIGNLTDDPDLRFTPQGTAVCNFRIAVNRKFPTRDGGTREETTFMGVNVWRDLAENVAESLRKGDRAVVVGSVKVRSYENRDGQTVWVTEIEADEVAPSLRWARAEVSRHSGSHSQKSSGAQGGGSPPPPSDDDVPF